MRIRSFVFNKTLMNTMFVSLGIHLFYFSCFVFTFEDKIGYSVEIPNIDFLGSVLRKSDVLVGNQVVGGSLIMKASEKFLSVPAQNTGAEQKYTSVDKPSFAKRDFFVGQKLPAKFRAISSSYEVKKKKDAGDTKILDKTPDWGSDLKLKKNDKN